MGKRIKLLLLALTAVMAANGCSSMSNTERDAIGGGVLGAGAGALLDRRHPGTGAAVGGIVGTVAGAVVGKSEDNAERRARVEVAEANAAANAPVRGPLTIEEVATMAKSGTSDSLIINQIRTSGTRYNLSGESIIWLQQNSVSEAVIREMQDTNRRSYAPRTVVVREPVVYERPYYYGPPPAFGFSYVRVR